MTARRDRIETTAGPGSEPSRDIIITIKKPCPKCGQRTMKVASSPRSTMNHKVRYLVCAECGATDKIVNTELPDTESP